MLSAQRAVQLTLAEIVGGLALVASPASAQRMRRSSPPVALNYTLFANVIAAVVFAGLFALSGYGAKNAWET